MLMFLGGDERHRSRRRTGGQWLNHVFPYLLRLAYKGHGIRLFYHGNLNDQKDGGEKGLRKRGMVGGGRKGGGGVFVAC